MEPITINYINNDGAGFSKNVTCKQGITLAEFFRQQVPNSTPDRYMIRVNRDIKDANYLLANGDRVSFTPAKVEGANS